MDIITVYMEERINWCNIMSNQGVQVMDFINNNDINFYNY